MLLRKLKIDNFHFRLFCALITVFFFTQFFLSCSRQSSLEKKKITLALCGPLSAQFAGYYVALNKGYYLEEGLELSIQPSKVFQESEEKVLSGEATFGIDWLPSLLVSRDKGKKIVLIGQIFHSSSLRLLVKKQDKIYRLEDLIKKRVATFNDSRTISFLVYLMHAGISATALELIERENPLTAFLKNEVDACVTTSHDLAKLIKTDAVFSKSFSECTILELPNLSSQVNLPEDGIIVSEKTKEENPELCIKFLRATLRGWRDVITNPEEAVDIVLAYDKELRLRKKTQKEVLNEILKLLPKDREKIGYLSSDIFAKTASLLSKTGLVSQTPSLSSYTNEFVQQAYSKK